jgi:SPP1 gp7 family putative phage head morphogenesis protein
MKIHQLKPIRETTQDFEDLEDEILKLFREEIYLPILEQLHQAKSIKNAFDDLADAIISLRITYNRGRFEGQLNSKLSRELRRIGAKWDRKQGSFSAPHSELPLEIKHAISIAEARARSVWRGVDAQLQAIDAAKVAEKLKTDSIFNKVLVKVEKSFQASVKDISIASQLTDKERARVAAEYTKNLQVYIQDFTQKETLELRNKIRDRSLSGLRYESVIKEIQDSYGVSQNKAKFLARQETSLMMTKFKQVRYQSAGIEEYYWQCVVGSPNHPVRPIHKALGDAKGPDGKKKIYRWDDPPVVNLKGERKNPGQDYNCRCVARPIVRF